MSMASFQSTHPRGVRHYFQAVPIIEYVISIHAPARGATFTALFTFSSSSQFQSTHPRGVRPRDATNPRASPLISIHAPARGATFFRQIPRRLLPISIHAPARGATPADYCVHTIHESISIHAPARGATKYKEDEIRRKKISIHAPARGATRETGYRTSRSRNFNPRTREGCDGKSSLGSRISNSFQSTHPRGVRR